MHTCTETQGWATKLAINQNVIYKQIDMSKIELSYRVDSSIIFNMPTIKKNILKKCDLNIH